MPDVRAAADSAPADGERDSHNAGSILITFVSAVFMLFCGGQVPWNMSFPWRIKKIEPRQEWALLSYSS